jgi:cobalt-zinc-cadmium efflux system membrane fusion protein
VDFRALGRLPRRQRLRTVLVVVALLAAAAADLAQLLLPSAAGQAAPTPAAPSGSFKPTAEQLAAFQIEPVRLVAFRSERLADGNIAIDDDLTTPVFSPYSGRVVRLISRLGDHVEPGAPLLAVEATEFVQAANNLITAVAALKTAHAQLLQAQVNEKRAHQLYQAQGGALKDWQQSQTDLASAQNAERTAGIALAAARNQLKILGKTDSDIAALEAQPTQRLDPLAVVTAPIAGTVTQRQVGLGQYIQSVASGASTPVYTIGNLSKVWLIANVRESDAPLMRVGAPVAVTVPAFPGRVFNATISWVAPALDANTHRLPVRADVENTDGALKPMMFANFSIDTGAPVTAPAAPKSAIVYDGETARVWVLNRDGTIAAHDVVTGRSDGGLVEIRSGVSEGDKIVTRGTLFLDRAGGTG